MARDAVWRLLVEDSELPALMGVTARTQNTKIAALEQLIIPNFSADQRPGNGLSTFIVIRWGADDYDIAFDSTFRRFDLYVHIPWDMSTDYNRIDRILNRCDDIFESANALQQSAAGDGAVLHMVEKEGRSGDYKDDGYETICRYASYKALSSRVSQVEFAVGGTKKR